MGILGFIKLFKKASMFFLKCQEHFITIQLGFFLNRNKKYLRKSTKGCSVSINSDTISKKECLNDEIKSILKRYKNDTNLILDYITKHKTKVFKLPNAKKVLKMLEEEPGLIPEYNGIKALLINFVLFKKISLKTEPLFIIDDKEVDIYYLIQQFHRWYFMKNNFPGFEQKAQSMLKQVNKGNESCIISKLKPDEISLLQKAIARDVDSITFVVKYAQETTGSKEALEKIKNGLGANI